MTAEPMTGADIPLPVHRRTITFDAHQTDGGVTVVGSLVDERPWAVGTSVPPVLHRMELRVTVRTEDLVIVAAQAEMHDFPHAECPAIAPAFGDLVGLSVARGYTRAVQQRFGGIGGCSHLEHLARLVGPVVVQAVASVRSRALLIDGQGDGPTGGDGSWLRNTCHIWADDGIGPSKVALGWYPGRTEVPAPPLDELRRRWADPADGTPPPT